MWKNQFLHLRFMHKFNKLDSSMKKIQNKLSFFLYMLLFNAQNAVFHVGPFLAFT